MSKRELPERLAGQAFLLRTAACRLEKRFPTQYPKCNMVGKIVQEGRGCFVFRVAALLVPRHRVVLSRGAVESSRPRPSDESPFLWMIVNAYSWMLSNHF